MNESLIQGVGINDMPTGWTKETNYNWKVYKLWSHVLERCYSISFLKNNPTYCGCSISKEWKYLSNFVRDIVKIPGYNLWLTTDRVALDKDSLVAGNQEYALGKVQFLTIEDNSKERILRNGCGNIHNSESQRKSALAKSYPVKVTEIKTGKVFEFVCSADACRSLGLASSNVSQCLTGKRKSHRGYKIERGN